MLKVARWRIILVALVTIWGIVFALPNLLPEQTRNQLPSFLPRDAINLGLDLQGGSSLLLEVDTTKLRETRLGNLADAMGAELRDAEPAIRFTGRGVVGDAARVRLLNPAELQRALTELRAVIVPTRDNSDNVVITSTPEGLIEARFTEVAMRELSRQAARQSIEIIRDRIDPTGVSEVSIVPQGDDRILVQAPGMSDPEELKRRVGQTALMTFHMVNDNVDPAEIQAGRVPPGDMVVQPYPGIGDRGEVVRRRPSLTGESLVQAGPSIDSQTQQYVLAFRMDSAGARTFCQLTTQFTGRRFAILLDNQVLTAPSINEPICGGRGQITGNFTAASASELGVMLEAGALPTPLNVIEQRSVGPELGADAIKNGAAAGVIAIGVTFIFMLLAYGFFGLIACVALVVNAILIVAAMTVVGAALTLPGIAGLILTIAMAVDANVLIYERMREEAQAGRAPGLAIEAGFARAIITIIDANLTTILAAAILFQFGAGPVRGFAWTLSIGVITSVFSAVLVTQIFISLWFRAARPKTLPI